MHRQLTNKGLLDIYLNMGTYLYVKKGKISGYRIMWWFE